MNTFISISLSQQRLRCFIDDQVALDVMVATAKNGAGERLGSECTPRGRHQVRIKIGVDCALNTVFQGRRPTGEIYNAELAQQFPQRDWVLTRILWLTGMEPGSNRCGDVDTLRRFIYLHGTPEGVALGRPGSHGCIRMANADIVRLFELVRVGVRVDINED